MRTAKWTSLLLCAVATLGSVSLVGCSDSDERSRLGKPATVFEPSVPDPRSDAMKISDFIILLERKYKREDLKNAIDLHFSANGPGRIKIRLTYDRQSDPTLVASIADAAVELAKRLKREDPSVRGLEIAFDRETVRREE